MRTFARPNLLKIDIVERINGVSFHGKNKVKAKIDKNERVGKIEKQSKEKAIRETRQ